MFVKLKHKVFLILIPFKDLPLTAKKKSFKLLQMCVFVVKHLQQIL